MKLETAQKLKWPWPTRHWDMYIAGGVQYHCPSVEEMLERMPVGCKILKVGEPKYMAVCPEYKDIYHSEFASMPDEALALLCIWLRDNNLMGWKEEGK